MAELLVTLDRGRPRLGEQLVVALRAAIGDGRHLRAARRAYRGRRDAVLAAVRRHLPQARVTGVAAGLHLVVELPDTVDDQALVARALAAGAGALVAVGAAGGDHRPTRAGGRLRQSRSG